MDPGKRLPGKHSRYRADLSRSVRLLSLRRLTDREPVPAVEIHAIDTYLHRPDDSRRFMPLQPQACRGCYYLG